MLASLPLEWRWGMLLLLFVTLFMSGLFDTMVIQVMGYPEVSRGIRMAVAAGMAFLVLCTGLSTMGRPALAVQAPPLLWETPLKLFLYLMPFWFLVGAVNGWPLTYLVGDAFMISILPLTYFVLTRLPVDDPRVLFRWIYCVMLISAVVATALVFYHNVLEGNRHKMSLDAVIMPTFYIMLKSAPSWLEYLLVPVFIVAGVATTKRSTWAGLLLVIGFALLLRPGVRGPLRLVGLIVMAGAFVFWLGNTRPELMEHTGDLLERRWQETLIDLSGGEGSDLSIQEGGRAGEVIGVFDTIIARNVPVDWVMGLGLGAIVQSRNGRERHHIHNTPAAFLARTGVIGLSLYLLFMLAVLRELSLRIGRGATNWHKVQFLFWCGLWTSATLFSMKSQAFWGSALGGIQLAYLTHLCRDNDLRLLGLKDS